MKFNPLKTVAMLIGRKSGRPSPIGIQFDNISIPFSETHVHLGITLSDDLKFTEHIRKICSRVNRELYVLRLLRRYVTDKKLLVQQFKSFILPHLEFGHILFSGLGKLLSDSLEHLMRRAIRIIYNLELTDAVEHIYPDLNLDRLQFRRNFALACYAYKLAQGVCPRALLPVVPAPKPCAYNIRRQIFTPGGNTQQPLLISARRSPLFLASSILNILPPNLFSDFPTMNSFKNYLTNLRGDFNFSSFPYI